MNIGTLLVSLALLIIGIGVYYGIKHGKIR
jgi:hypothetical protein